jgi:hypothetical protein
MRIVTALAALALLSYDAPALAQDSDWNHPSQQQGDTIKQTRDQAVDGLNNIGKSEDNMSPPGGSPASTDQVRQSGEDLVHKTGDLIDGLR